MKHTSSFLKKTLLMVSLVLSCTSYAFNSNIHQKQADLKITELYHKLSNRPDLSMPERIDWISQQFKDLPYELGSLGEGPNARYDQYPQYRIDAFDCETYVNTILALALADSLSSFQQCSKMMRYTDGQVSYLQRHHFTGLDWNQNHRKRGILQDITSLIKNKKNQPLALIATAQVNKPSWYAHRPLETVRLQKENKTIQEVRLAELKAKGAQLPVATEIVPYIPLTALFPKKDKPNMYLFDQIPNGAIIEIVRPNWDLREQIGTALNISHLGFAIRSKDQLYFRQASSVAHKIVDTPLIEYLQNVLDSPTIKGINIQTIVPKKPLAPHKNK